MADQIASRVGQRVDASGNVTYDFEGHISAEGIDLDAASDEQPEDTQRVAWLTEGGAMIASVWGSKRTSLDDRAQAWIAAHAEVGLRAFAMLAAFRETVIQAVVYVEAHPVEGNRVAVDVFDPDTAATHTRVIVDESEQSHFLQLRDFEQLVLAKGIVTVPTGGGVAATLNVNHNIGRQPDAIIVSPTRSDYNAAAGLYAANTFQMRVENIHNFAATVDVTCAWVALG